MYDDTAVLLHDRLQAFVLCRPFDHAGDIAGIAYAIGGGKLLEQIVKILYDMYLLSASRTVRIWIWC
jgi:hypothetical protein